MWKRVTRVWLHVLMYVYAWVSFLRFHKLFLFYFLETMSLSSMVPVGEANRVEISSAGFRYIAPCLPFLLSWI